MIRLLRISLAAFVSAATACSASYPTDPTDATPLALVVQFATPRGKVVPGTGAANTYTFNAFIIDSDNVWVDATSKVTWQSSDPGVARLGAGAAFNAVAPGKATAIARYQGLEASAEMVVSDPQLLASVLPRLEVAATASPKLGGATARATANRRRLDTTPISFGAVELANVTTQVAWTSSDTGIATVDGNGTITARGMGTVLITASMDGMSDWIWVSVAPPSQ